jgi:hypothetical protein
VLIFRKAQFTPPLGHRDPFSALDDDVVVVEPLLLLDEGVGIAGLAAAGESFTRDTSTHCTTAKAMPMTTATGMSTSVASARGDDGGELRHRCTHTIGFAGGDHDRGAIISRGLGRRAGSGRRQGRERGCGSAGAVEDGSGCG